MKRGTRALGFVLVSAIVCGLACVDSQDLRAEWLHRLVRMERYEAALDVYAKLDDDHRERATLRYRAVLAQLGVHGYGSQFVAVISRAFETHPQELWLDPRFPRMEAEGWREILAEAERLSRPEDTQAMRRTIAGVRYSASLILIRDAVRRKSALAQPLAAFRSAVEYCADMPPSFSGRFAHLNRLAQENAEAVRAEIEGRTDAALLTWLRAQESGDSE